MSTFLTTTEVGEVLAIQGRTVVKLIAAGQLPAIRIGARAYRIARADLDAYITAQRCAPLPDAVGEALAAMGAS